MRELKTCLEVEPFGEDANAKLLEFINKSELEIKLRSHIVNLAKKANKEFGIEYLSGVYDSSGYPELREERELYDILIELSSPLAGYLGRIKGNDGTGDRFYYLRDLPS
ncbi:MAG: hypothetical protein DCE90_14065 [Pseudanabaena sp.]|nr:MAG: hypothetical protein DCE90_14065 [Pseudanabaena sp.]